MNQSNLLNYKSKALALAEGLGQPVLDDLLASLSLIGGSVFGLFVNTKPVSAFKKIVRVETKADSNKRKIIYYAKDLNCSRMLGLLSGLAEQEIRDIGAEFFYFTSRKFSKNQSIDNFSRFSFFMIKSFGFDSQFVKNFFFNSRNSDEVVTLIDNIAKWDVDNKEEVVSKSVVCCLDRLSQLGQVDDLLAILMKFNSLIKDQENYQSIMQKFLFSNVYHVIHRGSSKEELNNVLETFKELGYEYNMFVCNKLLDIMNKNLKNNGFTDIVLSFMQRHNVEVNIITYNTIMDYYCINGQFEKAFELYKDLGDKNIKPDSFTYSILIKGIKSMEDPDINTAIELFEEYKKVTEVKDIILYNNILDALISVNKIGKIEAIMNEIDENDSIKADSITYNILIKGLCRNKEFKSARKFFNKMRAEGFKPNRINYNTLMDLAVKVEEMESALQILEDMQEDEISADGYTYSIILNGLKINDSSLQLIQASLKKIQVVLEESAFKLDEVFFNSIFDLCAKYDLYDFLEYFYSAMKTKKVTESGVTYGILLKAYCKVNDYKKAIEILEQMLDSGITINEITYGSVLDACTKSGNMELSLQLYHILKKTQATLSSIVFTTLLSGYIKADKYKEGIDFFNTIKHHTNLSGMLITYNCALDVLVRMNDMQKAYKLFEEIDSTFKADVVSYSTIIKGLCQADKKKEALDCMKNMINNLPSVDISVVNLLLDSCATPVDFKLAVQAYQYAMMRNIVPNEVTFGIMVKVYGFSRELHKAFDLLDLMTAYEIAPSIIVYTNLVHISFYNKSPKKAEIAFALFKKAGLKGDRLLYSKLITGLCRFKESQKVHKYLDYAISDNCGLKPDCIELLYDIFEGDQETLDKVSLIKELGKNKKDVSLTAGNQEKFKTMKNAKVRQAKPTTAEENKVNKSKEPVNSGEKRSVRKFDVSKAQQGPAKQAKVAVFGNSNVDAGKKPLGLFNFRQRNAN